MIHQRMVYLLMAGAIGFATVQAMPGEAYLLSPLKRALKALHMWADIFGRADAWKLGCVGLPAAGRCPACCAPAAGMLRCPACALHKNACFHTCVSGQGMLCHFQDLCKCILTYWLLSSLPVVDPSHQGHLSEYNVDASAPQQPIVCEVR